MLSAWSCALALSLSLTLTPTPTQNVTLSRTLTAISLPLMLVSAHPPCRHSWHCDRSTESMCFRPCKLTHSYSLSQSLSVTPSLSQSLSLTPSLPLMLWLSHSACLILCRCSRHCSSSTHSLTHSHCYLTPTHAGECSPTMQALLALRQKH